MCSKKSKHDLATRELRPANPFQTTTDSTGHFSTGKTLEVAKALEAAESRNHASHLVAGGMKVWARMGIDFTETDRDPWAEAYQRSEVARLELAAYVRSCTEPRGMEGEL